MSPVSALVATGLACALVTVPVPARAEPVVWEFTAVLSGTKLGPMDTEALPFGPAALSVRVLAGQLEDPPGSPLTQLEVSNHEVDLDSVASGTFESDAQVFLTAIDCCPGEVRLSSPLLPFESAILGIRSNAIIGVDLGLSMFDSGSFSGAEVVANDFRVNGEGGIVDVTVSEASDVRFRITPVPEVDSSWVAFVTLALLSRARRWREDPSPPSASSCREARMAWSYRPPRG